MTVMDAEARGIDPDKMLGLINYGLLFSSIFFVGVPGIVAVIIAYVQKGSASPRMREHYRFQIQIFWVAFLLGLIAGICGLWAVIDVAGQIWGNGHVAVDDASGVDIDLANLDMNGQTIGLMIASGVSLGLMALWALIAPAAGFIRLITGRTPNETA